MFTLLVFSDYYSSASFSSSSSSLTVIKNSKVRRCESIPSRFTPGGNCSTLLALTTFRPPRYCISVNKIIFAMKETKQPPPPPPPPNQKPTIPNKQKPTKNQQQNKQPKKNPSMSHAFVKKPQIPLSPHSKGRITK